MGTSAITVRFQHKGDLSITQKFLERCREAAHRDLLSILEKYARQGVDALSEATPYRTGVTAGSWYYEIDRGKDYAAINFCNSNVNKHVNIAIILQTGHGTGTGGYVQGRDYINPAIQPIFDRLADEAWEEVRNF